ncbi:hypothetical protein P43SY_003525 [Pythium insidiosum]|uniref:Copper-translocating P-type ATPase n=1 Tax=Pythium insidiosum TaxID=114742 RepID=A0AAD5LKP3_PYTIN|nr:hypothetical protein P43SY_003525 [Pythium insidiosum]
MGRRKKQAPARPDDAPAGMATGAEAVEVGGGSGPPEAVNGALLPRADAVSSCKDKPCCSSEKKKEAVEEVVTPKTSCKDKPCCNSEKKKETVEEVVAPKTSCKDKPCCNSEKKKEAVEEVVAPKTSCKDKPCCSSEKKKETVEEVVAPKTSCKDKPCCNSDNDAVISKSSCSNKASEQKSSCSGSVGKVAGDKATGCCAIKKARKVDKEVGSIVIGGTINAHGVLTVRVTHTINESMLARIVHLVDDAQAMKSRTEGLADAVSSYFTTFIICVAAVAFCDTPRPEARLVVEELRARKIQTWIVTGDQRETALAVAESLGIPDVTVIADALPHDKVDKVRLLQGIGKRVAFIGDGVNDGPALAMADVGVALGAGTDVALESADLVLVKDDLRDLLNAWDLSRATNRLIRWNFTWGFLYNFAMMPLACGALYPFFGLIIPPAFAGLSELLSSVPVILFSLLLNLWRPPFQDAKTDTLDARDETVITISGSNLSSSGGSQSSGPFAGVERSNVSETTPLLGSK